MKILFINRLAGTLIGGGENFVIKLIEELEKKGHEVEMITGIPLFGKRNYFKFSSKVYHLRSPYIRYLIPENFFPKIIQSIFVKLDIVFFRLIAFNFLRKKLNKKKYDIIFTTSLPEMALRIERILNIPVILREMGIPSEKKLNLLKKVKNIISNGDVYNILKSKGINSFFLSPGIDKNFFKKGEDNEIKELKNRLNLGTSLIILYVGRLVPVKNLSFLIKSFSLVVKRNSDVKLILVGSGKKEKSLKKQAKDLKISKSIIFNGAVNGENLPLYYKISDIFVLSSSYDNYPQVVNEAMASGLPVVATRVGGIPMQIEEGNTGFTVPLNDYKDFSNKVIELLENEEKRKNFGENGREKVKNSSWEKVADKFEELCLKIILNKENRNIYE